MAFLATPMWKPSSLKQAWIASTRCACYAVISLCNDCLCSEASCLGIVLTHNNCNWNAVTGFNVFLPKLRLSLQRKSWNWELTVVCSWFDNWLCSQQSVCVEKYHCSQIGVFSYQLHCSCKQSVLMLIVHVSRTNCKVLAVFAVAIACSSWCTAICCARSRRIAIDLDVTSHSWACSFANWRGVILLSLQHVLPFALSMLSSMLCRVWSRLSACSEMTIADPHCSADDAENCSR